MPAPIRLLALAAVAISLSRPAYGLAGEPPASGSETGTAAARQILLPSPEGFLPDLDRFLRTLSDLGIVSRGAANGLRRDFAAFADRNPETLSQSGFEYAIPSVGPAEETGEPAQRDAARAQPRRIGEILGMQAVTEDGIGEIFRHMFAPTKKDGIHFEMFVKEAYLAYVKAGRFRNADGTVDRQAVNESVQRNRGTYGILAEELEAMGKDGRRKRLVGAVNGMIAYAERKGLAFDPVQVRKGLTHMETCIGAKPGTNPALYAESCGQMMAWMGERPHAGTVEVQLYNSQTGKAGVRHSLTPWDPKYAKEVYGATFTDVQAKANDDFWRNHFKLYVGTAEANEVTLRARDSGEVLKLETAVGRTMKLLLCLAQGTPFEGRTVARSDVQAALDDAKRLRDEVETTASPSIKAWDGYKDTMRGFEQVLARARIAGLR